jgi:hypothetical protein
VTATTLTPTLSHWERAKGEGAKHRSEVSEREARGKSEALRVKSRTEQPNGTEVSGAFPE